VTEHRAHRCVCPACGVVTRAAFPEGVTVPAISGPRRAARGHWPTRAPLGYRNVTGTDGKKTIEPDPEMAPLVAQLFRWYATGAYPLKDVTRRACAAGLVYRSGNTVPVNTVHSTLRNRIYTGAFE